MRPGRTTEKRVALRQLDDLFPGWPEIQRSHPSAMVTFWSKTGTSSPEPLTRSFAGAPGPRLLRASLAAAARSSHPSAHRHFLIRIERERVAAVDLEVPKKLSRAAERKALRHRCGDADIDADHRRCGAVRELARERPLLVKIDVAFACGCRP